MYFQNENGKTEKRKTGTLVFFICNIDKLQINEISPHFFLCHK